MPWSQGSSGGGSTLPADQLAALDGTGTPSAGNPYVTEDTLDAAEATSAGALAAHVAAGDPHPAYALESAVDPLGQASGVRETSGPTTLALGAVADLQYLRRSGAAIVGAWLAVAVAVSSDVGGATVNDIVTSAGSLA